ncbi:MAG TPA: DUF58 domain-containing protein [Thermoanaerobaculia bacterium]|nr:DUF58 domain-containing protein [Thermoanaerobaculia bacterium]
MPAGRCFVLLAVATLLLVAGLLDVRFAWTAVALDLATLAAAWLDARRAARTPLTAERRWPPLLVQGAPAEIAVEVASGSGRERTVRLREGLNPGLAESPLRREIAVPASGAALWTYNLVPRRRGEHRVAPLTARVLGPWGLAWSQRDLLPAEEVRVYPQVRWEGKVGQLLALAQRHRMGQVPVRLHGVGTEPYALREYLPGDPLAKIHWKATARHGRMVSREDTWERSARLIILLDCARTMASMDGSRSKLDYALAAALALTRVAAARGDRVTVIAFSDRVERSVRVRSGGRGAGIAYAALYDLEARLTEPAYDLAVEAVFGVEPRSATAVLFTSVVDLAAAELLRESLLRLGRRHRSLLVNLEDPELRALADGEPATPAEAFAQVASLEIVLANRRLAKHLRRGGIRVISSPADRLALESLEAYLALYRGRQTPARAAG